MPGNGHRLYRQSPSCLEICKSDLISGHKSWGWPKIGTRSQGETLVSVTGLQSWKELERSPRPKDAFRSSRDRGPGKARPHAWLPSGLFQRNGLILGFLWLMIPLLPFSKTIPSPRCLPALQTFCYSHNAGFQCFSRSGPNARTFSWFGFELLLTILSV